MTSEINIDLFIDTLKSDNTKKTYKATLEKFYIYAPGGVFNIDTVRDFINYCKASDLKPSTKRLKLSVFNCYTKFLRDSDIVTLENWLEINNALNQALAETPNVKRHKFELPTDNDILKIYEYLKPTKCVCKRRTLEALRNRAIFSTLLLTGIRVSELCGLSCGDVDFDTGNAIIIAKGNKEQNLIIPKDAIIDIEDYLFHRNDNQCIDTDPVFSRHDKGNSNSVTRLSSRSVQNIIKNIKNNLDLEYEFTPHTMRRLFASNKYQETGNYFLIRELLGHSSTATATELYIHPLAQMGR